jgi:hypothetical protein
LQSFSFIITVIFQADATGCAGQSGGVYEHSPTFFHVRNQYFYYFSFIPLCSSPP